MVRLRLKVKEIAREKRITMSALQRAADIHMKTIQSIYKDPYHEAYYSVLYKIAKALNVPITDLVEVEEEERW